MTKKSYPTDVLDQVQNILNAWNQIDPNQAFGDLNVAALTAELAQTVPTQTQIASLETQLTNLRNQRDAQHESLWDKVKRVRASIKGLYGDDSSEYEMVGGTRRSERKPPKRKKAG